VTDRKGGSIASLLQRRSLRCHPGWLTGWIGQVTQVPSPSHLQLWFRLAVSWSEKRKKGKKFTAQRKRMCFFSRCLSAAAYYLQLYYGSKQQRACLCGQAT
jgi:hypothetical protein